jgi:23S rRNA (adenine2503-C2)-methyltransferase
VVSIKVEFDAQTWRKVQALISLLRLCVCACVCVLCAFLTVLAWSVHAVRDELRRQLVPTTKYTMVELRQGLIDTLKKRNLRTTMVEVALIDGVNDSMREADELANFVTEITTQVPGSKLICNLIPYNDIGGGGSASNFRKPSMERVLDFQKRLQELGVYTHVRGTRGDDESAACGQLATSRKQKQKESVVY